MADSARGPRLIRRSELGCAYLLLAMASGNLAMAGLMAAYGSDWWRLLCMNRPSGIILHHSASPAVAEGQVVDVHLIDRWHQRRGFSRSDAKRVYHVGYHYVILPDGTIQHGRPEHMRGAHCEGHNDQLGICLVGNFSSSANPSETDSAGRPTPAQLAALNHLLKRLIQRYGFTRADIHRHRDYALTACPGDRLPFKSIINDAFP